MRSFHADRLSCGLAGVRRIVGVLEAQMGPAHKLSPSFSNVLLVREEASMVCIGMHELSCSPSAGGGHISTSVQRGADPVAPRESETPRK